MKVSSAVAAGCAAIGMARIPYPRGIEIAGDFNASASE
jgi:hypothetical protein